MKIKGAGDIKDKFMKWFSIAQKHFIDADINYSSAAITYYLLLSLFPLLIALGNILTLFHIDPDKIMVYVNVIIPQALEKVLDPIVRSLITGGSGGISAISAIGLIWSASKGIGYIQQCMDKTYHIKPKNSVVLKRGIGVIIVMALLMLLVLFAILFSFGQVVFKQLATSFEWAEKVYGYFMSFKWPVSALVLFTILMLAYKFIPHVKLRMRDVWPGSLLSLVGILSLTQLFSIYVRFAAKNLNSYDALYTFVIMMLWLNFSATIFLAGTILNSTLYEYKYGKAVAQDTKANIFLQRKIEDVILKLSSTKKMQNTKFVQDMAQKIENDRNEELEAAQNSAEAEKKQHKKKNIENDKKTVVGKSEE